MKTISWEEIKPIVQTFCVWADQPELRWFRKAWKSLEARGLTRYTTDVDRHWVLIRGIALGVMYDDYCELEWDEHSHPENNISELYWDETISRVRIGAMAKDWVNPDDCDEHSLFIAAVDGLVGEVRLGVYDALVNGFGNTVLLYAGLRASRLDSIEQDELEGFADGLFDTSGFLIDGRDEAFAYVNVASMLARDA